MFEYESSPVKTACCRHSPPQCRCRTLTPPPTLSASAARSPSTSTSPASTQSAACLCTSKCAAPTPPCRCRRRPSCGGGATSWRCSGGRAAAAVVVREAAAEGARAALPHPAALRRPAAAKAPRRDPCPAAKAAQCRAAALPRVRADPSSPGAAPRAASARAPAQQPSQAHGASDLQTPRLTRHRGLSALFQWCPTTATTIQSTCTILSCIHTQCTITTLTTAVVSPNQFASQMRLSRETTLSTTPFLQLLWQLSSTPPISLLQQDGGMMFLWTLLVTSINYASTFFMKRMETLAQMTCHSSRVSILGFRIAGVEHSTAIAIQVGYLVDFFCFYVSSLIMLFNFWNTSTVCNHLNKYKIKSQQKSSKPSFSLLIHLMFYGIADSVALSGTV
ncbi:hypothetical protein BDR26DRAFT_864021 [Obelidium mucronatum]|nr:hypothetical protein BDR26DRAFT_864021 [Obelidium mucronatum]